MSAAAARPPRDRRQRIATPSIRGSIELEGDLDKSGALADVIWVRPGIWPIAIRAALRPMTPWSAVGPRQLRGNLQCRKLTLARRHRQERIADQTADQQPNHQRAVAIGAG